MSMDIDIERSANARAHEEGEREEKRNVDDPSFIVSSLFLLRVDILSPEMRVTEKGGAMAKTTANEYVCVYVCYKR